MIPSTPKMKPLDLLLAEILHKRASRHITAGRYRKAVPLLQTVLNEFPAHGPVRETLIQLYWTMADDCQKKEDFENARTYAERASFLASESSESIHSTELPDGKQNAGVSADEEFFRSAEEFLSHYFPDQIKWLDLAWRLFFRTDPSNFSGNDPVGALGLVGEQKEGRIAAIVATMMGALSQMHAKKGDAANIEKILTDCGQRLGADKDLVDRLVRHVLSLMKAWQP